MKKLSLLVLFAALSAVASAQSDLYPLPASWSLRAVASFSQPRIASAASLPAIASAAEGDLYYQLATGVQPATLYRANKASSSWDLIGPPLTAWEDLRFPAIGIDPAGLTAAASRDTDNGLIKFAGNAVNQIAVQVQMPHAWDGSYIIPHLHLLNGSSDTATTSWKLEYKKANIAGDFIATWTELLLDYQPPAATSTHAMPSFGSIDMTGMTGSSMLIMKLTRIGNTDAHNDDMYLLEFDIHYRVNKFGAGNY